MNIVKQDALGSLKFPFSNSLWLLLASVIIGTVLAALSPFAAAASGVSPSLSAWLEQAGPRYRMDVTLPEDANADLPLKHKQICENLGKNRDLCFVEMFETGAVERGSQSILKLKLVRGSSAELVSKISKTFSEENFELTSMNDERRTELSSISLNLDAKLLRLQRETLLSLANSASGDEKIAIESELESVQRELVKIEENILEETF